MDYQEDPPVQENPPKAPLAQPVVPPTQMMMYSYQRHLQSQGEPGRELDFFQRELGEL